MRHLGHRTTKIYPDPDVLNLVRIPKLIKCWGFKKIDEFCRERFCQARGSSGEHSEVVDRVGISNWRRIGIPEYSLIEDMIKCVNEIVKLEDEMDVKL